MIYIIALDSKYPYRIRKVLTCDNAQHETSKKVLRNSHPHYKKTVLLRWAKTATKGPFDLQWRVLLWRFFLSLLRCCYRSIATGSKSATIDLPFRDAFGLLRRAKNCHHMRLPFESSDLLVVGNKNFYGASCTTKPYVPFSGGFACRYMFKALATSDKRRYRSSIILKYQSFIGSFCPPLQVICFFFFFFLLGFKPTYLLQITCNNYSSTKTIPQMSPN